MKNLTNGMLVALVALAACSTKSGPSDYHLAEQTGAGGCPTAPKIVVGTLPVGSACTTAADCAPICCTCTTGEGSWLAADCRDDECNTANACADTASPGYCQ